MAPILKKGLFCCVSLRTCALILGSITLVGNLLTLSMFVVSLEMWLNHHVNQTDAEFLVGSHPVPQHVAAGHDSPGPHAPLHPDLVANISAALGDILGTDHGAHEGATHPWGHADDEEDYDGIDDSKAMEELLYESPYLALALVWLDFLLVFLETLALILLIYGAAKRKAAFLVPWLAIEFLTTLYDIGFFFYMMLSQVYIAIDLMPVILLPITVYCWLVVYSLYQECKETATRNATMPLSMSALEAGVAGGGAPCTVPYGRM